MKLNLKVVNIKDTKPTKEEACNHQHNEAAL